MEPDSRALQSCFRMDRFWPSFTVFMGCNRSSCHLLPIDLADGFKRLVLTSSIMLNFKLVIRSHIVLPFPLHFYWGITANKLAWVSFRRLIGALTSYLGITFYIRNIFDKNISNIFLLNWIQFFLSLKGKKTKATLVVYLMLIAFLEEIRCVIRLYWSVRLQNYFNAIKTPNTWLLLQYILKRGC